MRMRISALLVVVLVASVLSIGAAVTGPAVAGAVVPGGQRDFTLRYTNNVNGQIVMGGNTLVRCPNDTVDPALNRSCDRTNAGTQAGNNNAFDMQWVDIDGDPATFDSSSADVAVNGRVLFAGLYWTGVQKKGLVITGSNGYAGVPVAAPNESAIGTVKVKAPGSPSYRTVEASQIDTGPIANSSGYTAFADITSLVAGAGSGSYTVADVQTATGGNIGAGWTIIVAYADPSEPLRNLSVFDGLQVVSSSKPMGIVLSGFKTPSAGTVHTTIGLVAAEGDAGTTGDYLTVNDNLLTDARHPSNNTENSTIANAGSLVSTKTPNLPNQLGYDASTFVADGFLGNGDTSASFAAKTTNDVYAPQAVTFATELFSPEVTLTKTATVISGGTNVADVAPGGVIRYTITATNDGTQNAQDVRLFDAIPANTSLTGVPSVASGTGVVGCSPSVCSASADAIVGTLGASGTLAPTQSVSVQFDVVVAGDALGGTTIDNSAEIEFISPDLGLPVAKYASAQVQVAYPDPAVVKELVAQAGNQATFDVTVTNRGLSPTSAAIEVTDTLGASGVLVSASGPGWSCVAAVCSRSDVLAPNASFPAITVVATFGVGQESTNVAELTGAKGGQPTDPGSPALLNDIGYASGSTTPVSNLDTFKAFFESDVAVGATTTFGIAVRNPGPSTATDVTVVDDVPAGLRIIDVQVVNDVPGTCSVSGQQISCAIPSIEVGSAAAVFAEVVPEISLADSTVTNTAVVDSATSPSPTSASGDVVIRPVADLRLTKTADVTEADPGSTVVYTITATNDGPSAAQDITIVDHLPAAIDPSSVTITTDGSPTCSTADGIVSCVWTGATAVGAVHVLSIDASFAGVVAVEDRHAVNLAEVSSSTDELDPASNIDSALVKVRPYADVLADVVSSGAISPNGEVTVSFVMTNDGPSVASDGVMVIAIDPGLTILAVPDGCLAVGQVLTCEVGDLARGDSIIRDVVVGIGDVPAGTQFLNEVSVSSNALDPIDPILANNDDNGLLVVGIPPVIDTIGPDSGGSDGGTEVAIDGENFTPESQVDLGGTPCTGVELISSTTLKCTTGPHEPGDVDVTVINPDGLRAVVPGGFTYEGGFVPPAFTG